jgi:hypothetical protein
VIYRFVNCRAVNLAFLLDAITSINQIFTGIWNSTGQRTRHRRIANAAHPNPRITALRSARTAGTFVHKVQRKRCRATTNTHAAQNNGNQGSRRTKRWMVCVGVLARLWSRCQLLLGNIEMLRRRLTTPWNQHAANDKHKTQSLGRG